MKDGGDFAQHFRSLVAPRLREECRRQAAALSLGIIGWDEANHAVWEVARRYGAGFLPNGAFIDLMDWIGATLLQEEIAAEERGVQMTTEDDARRERDPVGYYEWLAQGKPTLQYSFSAACPEYRAHLKAEADRAGTSLAARRAKLRADRSARRERRGALYV